MEALWRGLALYFIQTTVSAATATKAILLSSRRQDSEHAHKAIYLWTCNTLHLKWCQNPANDGVFGPKCCQEHANKLALAPSWVQAVTREKMDLRSQMFTGANEPVQATDKLHAASRWVWAVKPATLCHQIATTRRATKTSNSSDVQQQRENALCEIDLMITKYNKHNKHNLWQLHATTATALTPRTRPTVSQRGSNKWEVNMTMAYRGKKMF